MSDQQPESPGPLPPFKSWQPGPKPVPKYLSRNWLIAAGATVVVLAVLVLAILFLVRRPASQPRPAAAPTPETGTLPSFVVQPGDIMTTLLKRAGVSDSASRRINAALKYGRFRFNRMKPGDSLTLKTRSGRLSQIYYRQSPERIYEVDLDFDPPRVGMLLRLVRTVPSTVKGSITSSLYEAMLAAGEEPSLIADYADVFGWEVDFFTETQPNDSFIVLVERRYLDSTSIGYGRVLGARYWGQIGDFSAVRFTDPTGHTDYYDPEGQNLRKTFLKSPLHFSRVTSFFGRRFHPILRTYRAHHGVDYAAPTGTPVSCVADGNVSSAGWAGGLGRAVTVEHPNGMRTRYGHLSGIARGIRAGARVNQGQVIGYVGSTGLSTGPHLHFEMQRSGSVINPMRFDPPRCEPLKQDYLPAFSALRDSLFRALPALASRARQQPPPAPVSQ